MYPTQFLLQIREIMGALDPKFDSNLQKKPYQIPKVCNWSINLWHLKCKKQLFENSYFLHIM